MTISSILILLTVLAVKLKQFDDYQKDQENQTLKITSFDQICIEVSNPVSVTVAILCSLSSTSVICVLFASRLLESKKLICKNWRKVTLSCENYNFCNYINSRKEPSYKLSVSSESLLLFCRSLFPAGSEKLESFNSVIFLDLRFRFYNDIKMKKKWFYIQTKIKN